MKLPNAKIESFIKNPDKAFNYILLYGQDLGLITQYCRAICKTVIEDLNDPFRVANLAFDKIKDEPSVFYNELNAISMLGGQRVIIVNGNSTSLPNDLAQIIENSSSDALVVFTAGELPATSSLRKFFEKAVNAVAIPCYNDDNTAIEKIIQSRFSEHAITCEAGVVQYLSTRFASDRMVILSELDKIITYLNQQKYISLSDVKEIVFDSSEFSLDAICMAFASRNAAEIERNMTKALSENIAWIVIIRAILRYFMRLQDVKNKIEEGLNEQQAISALRPPVFFKQAANFKRHLSVWKSADISRIMSQLTDLEIACKTTGNPAELLCSRMLLILPLAVR